MERAAMVCVCLGVAAALAYSAPDVLPVIQEVVVERRGGVALDERYESFVRAHITVVKGQTLDRGMVSRDVKALWATGRFADVGVDVESAGQGVRVVYVVLGRLKLAAPVTVVGADKLSGRAIRLELDLSTGDLIDDNIMGVRVLRVAEKYREKYYANADFSWEIKETPPGSGSAAVVLTVDEGRKSRVSGSLFEGNEAIASRRLRKSLRQYARWDPRRIFRKRSYETGELGAARSMINTMYMREGFLDVDVGEPRVELSDDGRFVVKVDIEEGVQYRFGKIILEGVALFPVDELTALISATEGDIASSVDIGMSVEALTAFYGDRGYINTYVRPVMSPDEKQGIVDVHLAVTEGKLVTVRNIVIRGNTRTRDKVVRRELLIHPGDVYNRSRVRRSERRVSNLGYFSSVRSHSEALGVMGEQDLVFDVEEKRTGQFMMGAGFSSIDKVVGFVELSQGNFDISGWPFTGGGQKLKLRGQFGSTRKDYALSFTEPWFMGRKLALGFELYTSDVTYSDYVVERTGGSISVRKALPYVGYVKSVYRLERISGIVETNAYVYMHDSSQSVELFNEDSRVKSSMRVTVTHDVRDNPFFPTRGYSASVFGHASGGLLGFDTDIYGLGARVSYYIPLWFKHVLNLKVRYEAVEEYGDTEDVPVADRLFLGGGRTLRGFDYRDVGPKARTEPDDGGYRATGGRSLVLANAEYTIPLVSGLRLAAFYDTGNVWLGAYEVRLAELASSAGFGIRFDLPGFPIRIDRAWVLESDDGITDEDDWVLWIGYDF